MGHVLRLVGLRGPHALIGEGESGKYYELAPGPWGEFHPYGFIDRHHYDPNQTNGYIFAKNCLKHTKHEPMVRLFVIEEEYPKKFNIPDAQYEAYYGKPKEFHPYYQTRFILTPDRERCMSQQPTWFACQCRMAIGDNPRLMADVLSQPAVHPVRARRSTRTGPTPRDASTNPPRSFPSVPRWRNEAE